ncbi:unnamed protein product [Bartonella choladocola]
MYSDKIGYDYVTMKKYLFFLILTCLAGTTAAHAADCTEVGKRVASEQGGTLARATLDTQNGNTCVVIVLIPARDGEKPRRVEVAVPAN